jgi:hypothetical protein
MATCRSIFAVLSCIAFISGCSSSTTTAAKTPDDEVHELIAKVKSLSEADRNVQGPAISARIMALKDKVSDSTKKEIDALYYTITSVGGNDKVHDEVKSTLTPVAVDSARIKPVSNGLENDAKSKSAPGGPELAPAPREAKK